MFSRRMPTFIVDAHQVPLAALKQHGITLLRQSVVDAHQVPLAALKQAHFLCLFVVILSILVDTLNSYKEDSYAAIGRAA